MNIDKELKDYRDLLKTFEKNLVQMETELRLAHGNYQLAKEAYLTFYRTKVDLEATIEIVRTKIEVLQEKRNPSKRIIKVKKN